VAETGTQGVNHQLADGPIRDGEIEVAREPPGETEDELAQRGAALEHQPLGKALVTEPVEEVFLGQL